MMASDILSMLRDLLIAQRDCSTLCTVPSGLLEQAETTLATLKKEYQQSGDESIIQKHEALVTVLDDLQEERAERIWLMAYHQADDVRAMNQQERFIFDILAENAAKLRGIA